MPPILLPPASRALPPLNTFALVGTSREAQQQYFGNSSWQYFNQANELDGQKYQLVFNNSISGYTTRQFLAGTLTAGDQIGTAQFGIGLAGALASGARFVVLGGCINDLDTLTGDQVWDSTVPGAQPGMGILQAVNAIIANGQIPVLQGEYLQEGNTDPAKIAQTLRFNQLQRNFAATGKAIYLDFPAALWNPATTTTSVIHLVANSTQDGTHPNILGGYLQARVWIASLSGLVPPLPSLSNGVLDQALPNNLFLQQTGGTSNGAGTLTMGTVPAGWGLTIPAGFSVVSSFVPDPSGFGSDWQLAITNTSGGAGSVQPYINAAGLTPAIGLQYQAGGQVIVAAGAIGYTSTSLNLSISDANGVHGNDSIDPPTNPGARPNSAATTSVLRTPPTAALTTTSNFNPYVVFGPTFAGNGSATVSLGRLWVRQL